MALKLLLVAFTTTREIEGTERRVRFDAKKVVDLSESELELLDKLTVATGKLHYREPISEGGKVVASEPEIVQLPDYEGQDVPMGSKNVDHLKAYLTFHGIAFEASAKKAELLALAQAHEAGEGDDDADDGDVDGGL
jgi:hypothetical protein